MFMKPNYCTTITARKDHLIGDVIAAYTSGAVEIYTIFDTIRVPEVAVFTLPVKIIRDILSRVTDRPNLNEQLHMAQLRVQMYMWVLCCFPIVRDRPEFDEMLWIFSRSSKTPTIHKPVFLRMGLLYDPEYSDEMYLMLLASTCTHISMDTRPFIRSAVQALSHLPDEIIHIIIAWTWGLQIDSRTLQRIKKSEL